MKKYVGYEKLSKKEKRAMDLSKRTTWGPLNPVTRKPENPKAYRRKKVQKGVDYELRFEPFIFYFNFSHCSSLKPTKTVSPSTKIGRLTSIPSVESRVNCSSSLMDDSF